MPYVLTNTDAGIEITKDHATLTAQPQRNVTREQLLEVIRQWQRGLRFAASIAPQDIPRARELELRSTDTVFTAEINGWQWVLTALGGENYRVNAYAARNMPYSSLEQIALWLLSWLDQ